MSDFGAIIKLTKQDGNFTDEEKEYIPTVLTKIVEDADLSSNLIESNYQEIHQWEDNTIIFIFCEYYTSHFEPDMLEFIQDNDLEELKEVAEVLATNVGEEYTVEALLEDW